MFAEIVFLSFYLGDSLKCFWNAVYKYMTHSAHLQSRVHYPSATQQECFSSVLSLSVKVHWKWVTPRFYTSLEHRVLWTLDHHFFFVGRNQSPWYRLLFTRLRERSVQCDSCSGEAIPRVLRKPNTPAVLWSVCVESLSLPWIRFRMGLIKLKQLCFSMPEHV